MILLLTYETPHVNIFLPLQSNNEVLYLQKTIALLKLKSYLQRNYLLIGALHYFFIALLAFGNCHMLAGDVSQANMKLPSFHSF